MAYLGTWPGLTRVLVDAFGRLCRLCQPGAAGMNVAVVELAGHWDPRGWIHVTTVTGRLARMSELGLLHWRIAAGVATIVLNDPRGIPQRPVARPSVGLAASRQPSASTRTPSNVFHSPPRASRRPSVW